MEHSVFYFTTTPDTNNYNIALDKVSKSCIPQTFHKRNEFLFIKIVIIATQKIVLKIFAYLQLTVIISLFLQHVYNFIT